MVTAVSDTIPSPSGRKGNVRLWAVLDQELVLVAQGFSPRAHLLGDGGANLLVVFSFQLVVAGDERAVTGVIASCFPLYQCVRAYHSSTVHVLTNTAPSVSVILFTAGKLGTEKS